MRILIAEDDFVSRQVLCRYLEAYGTCDVAIDGLEAVKAVEFGLDKGEPYDLICLDLLMPRMGGQEALRAIRQIEDERGQSGRARVLIATAMRDTENIQRAFLSKCDAYLVKPFNRTQIQEHLRAFGLI